MQKNNLDFVIDQATREGRPVDPIATAVAASIEVGVVVPSVLRSKLASAGFKIVEDIAKLADYGFASLASLKRVLVTQDGAIVAMGAAGDHGEALLHSMLGYFREHPLPDSEVPEGLLEAPTQPAITV